MNKKCANSNFLHLGVVEVAWQTKAEQEMIAEYKVEA